jgi:hypothetical protein
VSALLIETSQQWMERIYLRMEEESPISAKIRIDSV